MISFDEAIQLIASIAKPLGIETVPLAEAAGRVLAEPVIARIDSPRRDSSAMDGYAVREEDLAELPAELAIVGESFAGAGWDGKVAPGTCARIFTGAPVPAGADRVVIQENVRRQGNQAIVDVRPGSARYIRERGSDFAAGDELLVRGTLLRPRAVVAAAAADLDTVEAFRRPALHILSTGDELSEPGTARDRTNAIPDSVSLGVAAMAEEWGAIVAGRTRLRDDLGAMQAAAKATVAGADVIVVTGGASVGERDFARDMFAPLGLRLIFSKVSIKPGKPAWLGLVGDRFIVGLPGNPTSALVTARLFLAPLLALLSGRQLVSALDWRSARLGSRLPPAGDRETFHRATLQDGEADILAFQESNAQKALADADVLVRQPAGSSSLASGDLVQVLDF